MTDNVMDFMAYKAKTTYGLQFGDRRRVITWWVMEAEPTKAFWEACRADQKGMMAKGYIYGRLKKGEGPWRAILWEDVRAAKEEAQRWERLAAAAKAELTLRRITSP
jgi:hypothetical protein